MPPPREEVEKNHAALERADAAVDQARKAKQEFEHQAGWIESGWNCWWSTPRRW